MRAVKYTIRVGVNVAGVSSVMEQVQRRIVKATGADRGADASGSGGGGAGVLDISALVRYANPLLHLRRLPAVYAHAPSGMFWVNHTAVAILRMRAAPTASASSVLARPPTLDLHKDLRSVKRGCSCSMARLRRKVFGEPCYQEVMDMMHGHIGARVMTRGSSISCRLIPAMQPPGAL